MVLMPSLPTKGAILSVCLSVSAFTHSPADQRQRQRTVHALRVGA